jgi:riboflavin synthase
MFTGIIERMVSVKEIHYQNTNLILTLESDITNELYIDQSIAHNGACLTVTDIQPPFYQVTLIQETLEKTNFKSIKLNDKINIERSIPANARLDGHFVTGHIDTTGVVKSIIDKQGSKEIWIEHPENPYFITIPKGSVCVNGISLTVVESTPNAFSVHIIPYTYEHTNIQYLQQNHLVNIEFDILGKYIAKILQQQKI